VCKGNELESRKQNDSTIQITLPHYIIFSLYLHHVHPSLSPVVSLSLGILRQWTRMQNASHLRTSSRELEATTGAAAHNLDEEHS